MIAGNRLISIFENEDGDYDRFVQDSKTEFELAIGYLATWAFVNSERTNGPSTVNIFLNYKNEEILAQYYKDDKLYYVIGAIWREPDNKFSFHS